jgi:hypothetical protein
LYLRRSWREFQELVYYCANLQSAFLATVAFTLVTGVLARVSYLRGTSIPSTMRLLPVSLLYTFFASVVISKALEKQSGARIQGEASEDIIDEPQPTIFNGVEVPPLPDIDGEKFNTTVKEGYWFVKHHS